MHQSLSAAFVMGIMFGVYEFKWSLVTSLVYQGTVLFPSSITGLSMFEKGTFYNFLY